MNLLKAFQNNWRQKVFGNSQQPVLLACSGGRDSMALAHLMLLSKIEFALAHCNFQLRGNESDGDEQFVKSFATTHNIPFFNAHFNTQTISTESKKGIQETARNLRYEWLEMIRKEHGFSFIATAHHANDNVETLLINLFKGTGLAGLHGIKEVNGNIIRPMLFAPRADINDFVSTHQISYREDSSNSSEKYLRNDVRLNIIPSIEKTFPNAVLQMNASIQRFAQAEILYQKSVEKQLSKLLQMRGNDVYIPLLKLLKTEACEAIFYELFSKYGFSSAQIPAVLQLAEAESGKWMESDAFRLIKDRACLIITQKKKEESSFHLIEDFTEEIVTLEGVFSFKKEDKRASILEEKNIALVDADKLEPPLILRRWRMGDYFYPFGMGMKKKKLAKFFVDQKIPIHEKEKIWVLESNKHIVWVAGHRLDERFKVRDTSKNILNISFVSDTN